VSFFRVLRNLSLGPAITWCFEFEGSLLHLPYHYGGLEKIKQENNESIIRKYQ